MKKMFLGLLLAAALFAYEPAQADGRWGAFGAASDLSSADTGIGGGAFFTAEMSDTVNFNGRAMALTYDDLDRAQLLLGGEWLDAVGKYTGYIGLQAGVEILQTDAADSEDAFARLYYDIGWNYSNKSEIRVGLALDDLSDSIERKGGVRVGWFHERDDSLGFFLNGEFYEDEKNVFAGVYWPF